jgi:hypothetical protein
MRSHGLLLAVIPMTPRQSVGARFIRIWGGQKPNSSDVFSAVGTGLMVVIPLLLATGLTMGRYFARARDRMRRVEGTLRRRAARRMA